MALHLPIGPLKTRSGLKEIRKKGNVLFNDALNTFFIYGYMASDIWLRTILIVRKETRGRQIGYSFRLTARVLLYAPSHRQDSTYHGLCYTSRGVLAGTRNSSMGSPHEGSIRRPIAQLANALTTELHLAPLWFESGYRDANPVPTSPLADDITTGSSGPVEDHTEGGVLRSGCRATWWRERHWVGERSVGRGDHC